MTTESLAREELYLSFMERQTIVDDASDAWLNTLPLGESDLDTAILDFQARMLPEVYSDYNHTAPEIMQNLRLDQRFFVLRGIANALQLDPYQATAVAQRMGVHFSVMFPARQPALSTESQPTLFNYWSKDSEPDAVAV